MIHMRNFSGWLWLVLPDQRLDPLPWGSWTARPGAPNAPRSGCYSNWRCCPGSRCLSRRSSAPSGPRSLRDGGETRTNVFIATETFEVRSDRLARPLSLRWLAYYLARLSTWGKKGQIHINMCTWIGALSLCAAICVLYSFNMAGLVSAGRWGGGSEQAGDIFTLSHRL